MGATVAVIGGISRGGERRADNFDELGHFSFLCVEFAG
jgi:hypothetical protein